MFQPDAGAETVITGGPQHDNPFDFGDVVVDAGGLLAEFRRRPRQRFAGRSRQPHDRGRRPRPRRCLGPDGPAGRQHRRRRPALRAVLGQQQRGRDDGPARGRASTSRRSCRTTSPRTTRRVCPSRSSSIRRSPAPRGPTSCPAGRATIRSRAASGGDQIRGFDGADLIRAGLGKDLARGGAGPDVIYGGGGDDDLRGGGGDDALTGGPGADTLQGGAGRDQLTGGEGADTLDGGAGSDRFVYQSLADGQDQIGDFETGRLGDVLDLSDLLAGFDPAGSDPGDFVSLSDDGAATAVAVNPDGQGQDALPLVTLERSPASGSTS